MAIERSKPRDQQNEGLIDDLNFRKRRFFAQSRRKFYNKIIRTLAARGFIHKCKITREQYKDFSRWQTDSRISSLPPPMSYAQLKGLGTISEATALNQEEGVPSIEQEETPESGDDPSQPTSDAAEAAKESLQTTLQSRVTQDAIDINYFYFGDLIAVITADLLGDDSLEREGFSRDPVGLPLTIVDSNTPQKQINKPSSTFNNLLQNFTTIIGTAEVSIKKTSGAAPPSKIYNLAHIPISLESFSNFMIEQVVSQDKIYYSYFSFLDDLLSHMFTNVMGAECFGGLIESKLRPGTGIIEQPKPLTEYVQTIPTPLPPVSTPAHKYRVLDLNLCTPDTPAFEPACGFDNTQRSNSHTHFVIYSSNVKDDKLAGTLEPGVRGDPTGDRNRGIIHTAFGLDRGLLRNVQFQKTDQEYLPEARFSSEGDNIFNQIANVYDVTFGFSGTTLFRPGQLIYFNPSSVGAGNSYEYQLDAFGDLIDRSWANLMGLGGYHIITEVANVIESGKYETTVKARWVTGGKLPVVASVMSSPPSPSMGGN